MGIYFYESKKSDLAITSLVASETVDIDMTRLLVEEGAEEKQSYLEQLAAEYMKRNYVVVKLFDGNYRQIAKISNPQYQNIEQLLQDQSISMPRGLPRHYRKFSVADQVVVEALVSLPVIGNSQGGYYYAAFLLEPQVVQAIRERLRQSVTTVLLIVFITTVIMYPVIIGLHRALIRASMKILHGNFEIAAVLGKAIAKRDTNTSEHNYRVALYAIELAKVIGVKQQNMPGLILGAFLHDVGKIGIPDAILRKPEKLTTSEYEIMKSHVAIGKEIVATSEWLATASEVIENHHEKYDGTGYVRKLRGTDIPFNARLFAVVDVFDALTADRPYKKSVSVSEALMIIERSSGTHFDPDIAATFCRIATHLFAQVNPLTEPQLAKSLYREAATYLLNIKTASSLAGNMTA